ncbi:MAG TPA: hypothetical protein VKV17_10390 [Bryobacteraceae bacterium]|nr:hypothetical protein [Bryobacteraceae bacterium]
MRRNLRAAFLFGAISFRRDSLAMPVNEFGNIRVMEDIDTGFLAFPYSQNRTGNRPVIGSGADRMAGASSTDTGAMRI